LSERSEFGRRAPPAKERKESTLSIGDYPHPRFLLLLQRQKRLARIVRENYHFKE